MGMGVMIVLHHKSHDILAEIRGYGGTVGIHLQ